VAASPCQAAEAAAATAEVVLAALYECSNALTIEMFHICTLQLLKGQIWLAQS
jgi:hypothetical protein